MEEFSQPVIHVDPQRLDLFSSSDTARKRMKKDLVAAAHADRFQCPL